MISFRFPGNTGKAAAGGLLLQKYGIDAHLERVEADTGIRWEKERYICSVQGRLRFVLQVNPQDDEFAGYCREWKELFM